MFGVVCCWLHIVALSLQTYCEIHGTWSWHWSVRLCSSRTGVVLVLHFRELDDTAPVQYAGCDLCILSVYERRWFGCVVKQMHHALLPLNHMNLSRIARQVLLLVVLSGMWRYVTCCLVYSCALYVDSVVRRHTVRHLVLMRSPCMFSSRISMHISAVSKIRSKKPDRDSNHTCSVSIF